MASAIANQKVRSKYIPDHISYSILSKLPLKSLKRFQCVQKSWSLLFQNHHFMNIFLKKFLSNNDPSSFILRDFSNHLEEVFYSFSGERFENKVQLDWSNPFQNGFHTSIVGLGSVNGILCLYRFNGDIVLWNPATQTFKTLPDSQSQFIEVSIQDEAQGYVHCAAEYLSYGFGYDPVMNDFKVIRFVNVHLEFDEEAEEELIAANMLRYMGYVSFWEIYSQGSKLWRKLHVKMPYSFVYNGDTQVYMDGVCHWLCEGNRSNGGPCLVSFNLSNEKFLETPIPSDVDDCFVIYTWIKLAVLNGSITLISYHENTTTFHISILGEFGTKESWTKLLIVGPLSCVQHPIGVGMKGEIVFVRKDKELVWLDLSTQMIAKLGYKEALVSSHSTRIIIYKESFHNLN